jgi:nitrate reductase gamma subunit
MNALSSLVLVLVLAGLGWIGGAVAPLRPVFGVALPALAAAVFLVGVVVCVLRWARTPVPFRIPTTSGQQRALPWIKSSYLDNPWTRPGVVFRMLLEVLLFRSLFRNTQAAITRTPVPLDGHGHGGHDEETKVGRLVYAEQKWLWAAALGFHWSFLIVLLRHLRFFMEPPPAFAIALASLDGFFQVGLPALYITDLVLLAGLGYLLARRLVDARVRYLSLFQDYFALYLILGLALSGVLMRYFVRPDIVAIKQLVMAVLTFSPAVPAEVAPLFFVHLFLLSVLVAYFPFSKLMHMAGVFLSPTRNLANTNRSRRHVNPWNYPVKVHTYEEWEHEFHDKIKAAGLPLEKA